MTDRMIWIADDFVNIRGSFKLGDILDIGTQASLVRRANGKFVFLDSYTLSESVQQEVDELTDHGKNIEAILNLHPFHTVHVRAIHERYPKAKLFGTARHLAQFPDLPWQKTCTEHPRLHKMFAEDFEFSVPRGVDFVSANEKIHFSSVLVLHRASKTIHVDDTLMFNRMPLPMRILGMTGFLMFHPTLMFALQPGAASAKSFLTWAQELAERWHDAENLCAAHSSALIGVQNRGASIHDRILTARKIAGAMLSYHT